MPITQYPQPLAPYQTQPPVAATVTPAPAPVHTSHSKISTIEHFLIKLVSVILIVHGLIRLYNESIEIFYVLPAIPRLYRTANFNDVMYMALVRKSVLATVTTFLESIYGLFLITKPVKFVKKFHLISAIILFILSILLLKQTDMPELKGFIPESAPPQINLFPFLK
jgi:hypothetical protein